MISGAAVPLDRHHLVAVEAAIRLLLLHGAYFPADGGVGRATSSSGRRATMRPPGNRTRTTSTVVWFGSWNEDVFTGSTNYLPF
jgi:hypothetical protein